MTSENSILGIETQQNTVDKKQIAEYAKKFDIAAPVSEGEFETALQKLATFLLFNTNWDPSKNITIPKKIPIISDVPLVCKGFDCKYAQLCPVLSIMRTEDVPMLNGTQCRADKLLGVQHFTALVKDLNIDPTQTVDVINVANLIRWMIYRRRIDWQIAIEGLTIQANTGYDHKNKQTFGEQKEHPLLKVAEKVDNTIDKAQKSLVASRKDRLSAAAQFGAEKDILKSLLTTIVGENLESLPPPEEDEDAR